MADTTSPQWGNQQREEFWRSVVSELSKRDDADRIMVQVSTVFSGRVSIMKGRIVQAGERGFQLMGALPEIQLQGQPSVSGYIFIPYVDVANLTHVCKVVLEVGEAELPSDASFAH